MPAYKVTSGDFNATIIRGTHQKAAEDAIGVLREGDFYHVRLGMMTEVALLSEPDEPMFMSTLTLVRYNGLNYRHNGLNYSKLEIV